jgi:hypothetical protein
MYILNSSQQLHLRNLRTSTKIPFIIQRRVQTRPEFTMARTSLLVRFDLGRPGKPWPLVSEHYLAASRHIWAWLGAFLLVEIAQWVKYCANKVGKLVTSL